MPGKMLFIVGNSRSGTTMLGRILGSHSEIHTFGELHFFEHQIDAVEVRKQPNRDVEKRVALAERLITSARDGFFSDVSAGKYLSDAEKIIELSKNGSLVSTYEAFLHYEAQRHGKTIPCEQTPRYLFFVDEILEVFPDAIVINMVRDPRDVLLSQKNKWRRRLLGAKNIPLKEAFRAWVNYHPYMISRLWLAAIRTASRFEGDSRFISIRFEDLLNEPERLVRTLCARIGVCFEKEMLSVPQVGSSTGKDMPNKKGIDKSRAQAWKRGGLSEVELHICERITASEMKRLGYEVEGVQASRVRVAASMFVFAIKAIMAVAMNLGRSRNMIETIKRRLAK